MEGAGSTQLRGRGRGLKKKKRDLIPFLSGPFPFSRTRDYDIRNSVELVLLYFQKVELRIQQQNGRRDDVGALDSRVSNFAPLPARIICDVAR